VRFLSLVDELLYGFGRYDRREIGLAALVLGFRDG